MRSVSSDGLRCKVFNKNEEFTLQEEEGSDQIVQELTEVSVSEETRISSPRFGRFSIDDPSWLGAEKKKNVMKNKNRSQVFLEGYVESCDDQDELGRTKSLTDEDLEELKGCLDLGFGFNYDEIPELCSTLPALELCYSMSQKYLDDQQKSPDSMSDTASSGSSPIPNWRISGPGDNPEDVKARLKFWAQTVACTVRLCS